jgi:hypothetical protein
MGNNNERITYNYAMGDMINQEGRFVTGVDKSDRSVSGQRISEPYIQTMESIMMRKFILRTASVVSQKHQFFRLCK